MDNELGDIFKGTKKCNRMIMQTSDLQNDENYKYCLENFIMHFQLLLCFKS